MLCITKLNAFLSPATQDWRMHAGEGGVADGTLDIVVMAVVTDISVTFPPGSLTGFTSSRLVLYCTLEKNNCSQSKKIFFLASNWGYTTGILS